MRRRSWAAALCAAVVAAVVPGVEAGATGPRPQVSVVRDSAGIPHIRARDFRSLGHGEGFSYAQDNACLFAEAVVTVRGERTRFFGADGTAYSYSNGAADPNPKSDAFWRWARAAKLEQRLLRGLGRDAAALYRGWAEGFNAYLRSGALRDPACRGRPWVRPVTVADLGLRGLQILTGASSGLFLSGLHDAQPPAAAGAASARRAPAPRPDPAALRRATLAEGGQADLGSNALALGAQGTRAGTGMLLANPHFPWRGVDRFWMAHLTVPGRYDVMGGTLGGFPLIGVGFNRHLAWTHTVSTGRRFVVVQLRLAPGDPTRYVVDGRTIPMTRTTVSVAGNRRTFYGTRYGLVVTIPQAGYGWTRDTAYALLDANLTNAGAVDQYLAMGRSRSVRELLAVAERGRAIPFFNTIAADRTGTALYADVGRYSDVPRSLIERCTPEGAPRLAFAAARLITLDGSRASCRANGLLPARAQPRLLRRDFVQNSNDSFWLANPAAPITGITPLIGLSDVIQGVRTRWGILAVRGALARGQGFTIPGLQRFWQSDRNHLAELAAGQLAQLCRDAGRVTLPDGAVVDVSEACPVLERYDRTGNLDSRGAWLFAAYTRRSPSGADFWSDAVDLSDPARTPNRLNRANPQHLVALGRAVQELRSRGIPLDSGMRGVQVATRGSRRISIHGCANCYQNINASNGEPAVNAPYGEVVQGSSMVLTTELTRRGPRGEGILTYSQATDPTSPWFRNMTERFSRKGWERMRFAPADLAADEGRRGVRIPGTVRPSP